MTPMADTPAKFRKLIAINEHGRRIGETHHRARLSDRDVDVMRELHEEHGVPYSNLAAWFGVSESTVQAVCRYRIRAQTVAGYRRTHKP